MDTYSQNGILYSVDPCTKYLTFDVWIYLVPQYRPQSVLLLGYAGGTVAGLIRKLYGDVLITAVDVNPATENKYGVEFIQADAEQFVRQRRPFDAVVVDIFEERFPPEFVKSDEFAENLAASCNYVVLHVLGTPGVWNFLKHFERVHEIVVRNSTVYYFRKTGAVPDVTVPSAAPTDVIRL